MRIERNEWEDLHNNTAAIFFNYQAHVSDKLRTKHQTNLQRCLTWILRNRFLKEKEKKIVRKSAFPDFIKEIVRMSKSEEKKADNRVYARSVWAIAQIRKATVLKRV